MIFFDKTISKNVLNEMIKNEKIQILGTKKKLLILKKSLVSYIESLTDSIGIKGNITCTQKIIDLLSYIKKFLDSLPTLECSIVEILKQLKYLNANNDDLSTEIDEYNKFSNKFSKAWNLCLEEYNNLMKRVFNTLDFLFLNFPEVINTSNTLDFTDENYNEILNSDVALSDNNCLLISEKQNKVFLPYTISQLNKQLENCSGKYRNIREIIETEYIVPLSRFKNPIVARFRETYNLMKFKEHASILRTLDLALELSLDFTLHPAIIAACKNKNQLYIYLDYLHDNQLDKFTLFEIKYEVPPIIKK